MAFFRGSGITRVSRGVSPFMMEGNTKPRGVPGFCCFKNSYKSRPRETLKYIAFFCHEVRFTNKTSHAIGRSTNHFFLTPCSQPTKTPVTGHLSAPRTPRFLAPRLESILTITIWKNSIGRTVSRRTRQVRCRRGTAASQTSPHWEGHPHRAPPWRHPTAGQSSFFPLPRPLFSCLSFPLPPCSE